MILPTCGNEPVSLDIIICYVMNLSISCQTLVPNYNNLSMLRDYIRMYFLPFSIHRSTQYLLFSLSDPGS